MPREFTYGGFKQTPVDQCKHKQADIIIMDDNSDGTYTQLCFACGLTYNNMTRHLADWIK